MILLVQFCASALNLATLYMTRVIGLGDAGEREMLYMNVESLSFFLTSS